MSELSPLFEPTPNWFAAAACRGMNPELFHPERGEDVNDAKRVCADCPVAVDCLEYALGRGIKFGIWGGKSERERRKIRRTQPQRLRTAVARCGTTAGYAGHRRRGETCEPCRAANALHTAERAARVNANGKPAAACGTEAGYNRHLRRSEPACTPCRDAKRAAQERRRTASA